MKKLASIFLALVMVLSLSVTAFAVEDTILTIDDSTGARTYNGYQLLTLTTSLKEGENHTAHTGDHTDDCYNYAYTVNEKYRAVLQRETFGNADDSVWGTADKPVSADLVSNDQILDYLSKQTSDSGDTYGTLRTVADRIYRAIKNANIEAEKTGITDTADIEKGYWMFADVTALTGEDDATSLVMVDTKGADNITITPKVSIPTVEKKVKDIKDSEEDSITDNPWQDSADHDICDEVPFKLTAGAPSNAQFYDKYTLVFHDTLSAGLTLNEESIEVYMYDTKHKADEDTDLNEGVDVTKYFTATTSGLGDGCTFEVGCDNVKEIPGMTLTSAFVVYYKATLNENAVIGAAGNPNKVYLEFSNNPYGQGTGKTEEDKVIVFTYKLVVNKTDSHGHALKGAGFTLSKKNLDGTYTDIGTELKDDDMTTFEWKGLDDGDYKLVESTVPAGYNKIGDILFSITATHSETADEPALLTLDGGLMGTGVVEPGANSGVISNDIVNNTGTVLPETGGAGTVMLISCSSLFVVLAAVFMITRKKMSIYED